MKKILIITNSGRAITDAHIAKIKAVAPEMEIVVANGAADIARHLPEAEILVTSPRTFPPLAEAARLKWLHSFSAGMDRILTPEVARSPMLLSNSAGALAVPIAEHVLAYMLIFARGFLRSLENQREHRWQRGQGLFELCGKAVLVVGMGHIGGEVARRAHAFGCPVLATTRSGNLRDESLASAVDETHPADALPALLPRADFVVSCLPDTPETHHIFNAETFALMKPSAYFINIGRGGLANETDLSAALRKKTIAGAALDVTETEPLPAESPLWEMPNVIITPHHSGSSERATERAIEVFCRNLAAYGADEPLPTLVDKQLGY